MAVMLKSGLKTLAVNAVGDYGGSVVRYMIESGTKVVAHVAPGRTEPSIDGLPRFSTIEEAVAATGAKAAAVYTPAAGVRDSLLEAAKAGLELVFAAAEFVPVHDVAYAAAAARDAGMWVVGPNSLGMCTPGQAALGAMPRDFVLPGRVGMIGRSGTLTLNMCRLLTAEGIGQSTVVHMGGDVICGRNPHEWLQRFLDDPDTDAVLYTGEPGGTKEYAMLETIAKAGKPVVALVVGRHSPRGKVMGHAGALIGADRDTAAAKSAALREAGAHVVESPLAVVTLFKDLLPSSSRQEMESAT
jgi:succinyl-CoA synthetase alpha subunit